MLRLKFEGVIVEMGVAADAGSVCADPDDVMLSVDCTAIWNDLSCFIAVELFFSTCNGVSELFPVLLLPPPLLDLAAPGRGLQAQASSSTSAIAGTSSGYFVRMSMDKLPIHALMERDYATIHIYI